MGNNILVADGRTILSIFRNAGGKAEKLNNSCRFRLSDDVNGDREGILVFKVSSKDDEKEKAAQEFFETFIALSEASFDKVYDLLLKTLGIHEEFLSVF